MDTGIIAGIILVVINVVGWAFSQGRLNGQVKAIKEAVDRHDKVLNDGLVQELSKLQSQVANLEGTVSTYIELTERSKHQ